MNPVFVLQHIDCETLGTIENTLAAQKLPLRYIRSFEGESVPKDTAQASALIVMGGPMGVYEAEQYPFLKEEMKLIESALRAGIPVLGICLGSQLLAHVLGATVRKGAQKEIGWYPVRFSSQAKTDALFGGAEEGAALHWHGDVFDLPEGAVQLASSDLTAVQAYRYGRNAYGLLFHLEVTAPMVREWTARFSGELVSAGLRAEPILNGISSHLPGLTTRGGRVFGNWARLIEGASKTDAVV